ncbi:uncharacterized protein KQ657_002758 [Scheffersomyces spartinae]|uniref:Mediator of RNA polymerase II transcription subunit 9 n=1 Tax=Scheffersomyces spartinae TaxID=45513 RepID=A0A9P7V5L2_9ASCO|nr:uncharacterized protein KQ657_002758 [Scheffersomyces spartinae]KAG7191793.1 hypothetical protein KQ657_002758 [Scheffersomyces spartinae]
MDDTGLDAGFGNDAGVDNGTGENFLLEDIQFTVIPNSEAAVAVKDEDNPLVNALGISNSEGIEVNIPAVDDNIATMEEKPSIDGEKMDIDNDEVIPASVDSGPLEKLRNIQLLPELFNLLYDLRNGTLLAKDFGSNAGSLRLKLTTFKQCLQEIEGINESIEERQQRIQLLTKSKTKKEQFLMSLKSKIEDDFKGSSV